jgi:hypothetical protein
VLLLSSRDKLLLFLQSEIRVVEQKFFRNKCIERLHNFSYNNGAIVFQQYYLLQYIDAVNTFRKNFAI